MRAEMAKPWPMIESINRKGALPYSSTRRIKTTRIVGSQAGHDGPRHVTGFM